MVRRALKEDKTLILVMTLTALLIMVICGTTCFTAITTAASAATTTQLKTYTYPTGFFTLQYPADWIVEYKQPVTRFDKPSVTFKGYNPVTIVTISVKPSTDNTPEEFRDSLSSLASDMANGKPGLTIIDHGFRVYSIAGYDTYAVVYEDANIKNPTSPVKGMYFLSRIGYQEMSIAFVCGPDYFDQQMPIVQKMIDSIKVTGVR